MEQPLSRWLAVPDDPGWGTTAETRRRQAPDPEAVALDFRDDAHQIRCVQELAKLVRWWAVPGVEREEATRDWQAFCTHPQLTAEAMASLWSEDSGSASLSSEQLRWLGRPHFALLLVFIRLLRHQRQLLNALTARHLDHYYRERLGFAPRPGEADRVTVAFTLAEAASPLTLGAGTVLRAGLDEHGRERLYRTLTDLALNHARVRHLRAIERDRGLTTLATLRAASQDPTSRLNRMLGLAYGEKAPSVAELSALLPTLSFCAIDGQPQHLQLDLEEFPRLMRLVRQRTDAGSDQEWAAINEALGVDDLLRNNTLTNPRDFTRNVSASLLGPAGGPLDWRKEGLSGVNSINDFYLYRDDVAVKKIMGRLFAADSCRLRHTLTGTAAQNSEALMEARLDTFAGLMTMKLHIDAQWQQVNWLLERCGTRRRKRPSWRLDASTPNSSSPAFATNLATTLGTPNEVSWPAGLNAESAPAPPADVPSPCWWYFLKLEDLERRHALPLVDLRRLCELATNVSGGTATADDWTAIQTLLEAAHRERWVAERRAALDRCREGSWNEDAYARVLRRVARDVKAVEEPALSWPLALAELAPWLSLDEREALRHFGEGLRAPGQVPRQRSWEQVIALLEETRRAASGEQPPELSREEWLQWHGRQQEIAAEAMAAGVPLEPCFPRAKAEEGEPTAPAPAPGPGFAVASRVLALAEGSRHITLTLGFPAGSGSPEALLASLRAPSGRALQANDCAGVPPPTPEEPGWGLNQALLVEMSTAEGWWLLPIASASASAMDGPKPAPWELTLGFALAPSDPPLAPLAAGELPRLRLRLRPWREGEAGEGPWGSCGGFEELRLASARLRVEVRGLKGLRLQQESAKLDPREPFTPFSSGPEVGSALYISHPELLDGGLEEIRFSGQWRKLPADLTAHYSAYRGWPGLAPDAAVTARSFVMDVSLLARHGGVEVEWKGLPLFAKPEGGGPANRLALHCPLPQHHASTPAGATAASEEDLREQARVWRWRLTPLDFGHGLHPALAARKAQEMALAISDAAGRQALALAAAMGGGEGTLAERYASALKAVGAAPINPADFAVPEPYTPLLEDLEVSYSRVQQLGAVAAEAGEVRQVHLFGEEEPLVLPPPPPAGGVVSLEEAPLLLPSHPYPGELWLELEGTRPGLPMALAFQLAEGSALGVRPVPAVEWEVRQGWRWQPLRVEEDGTAGLLHSGLLRFTLPETARERLWIRACLRGPVEAYAALLALQSQAVEAEAVEASGEEVAEEAPRPLPPHSITGLEEPVPGIVAIHQPFSSRTGRAAETEAELRIRAAERLRHKGRALTNWDYERLLWDAFASQLHAVVCLPAGENQPVQVVVIPNLRDQVPRNLFAPGAPVDQLAAMERHLRQRAPREANLVVRNASYAHVMAEMRVCLPEEVNPVLAERDLRETVIRALSPWCFDAAAEVRLGGEVRTGDLAAVINALPCVAHLERLKLFLVDPGGKPLRLDGVELSSEEILRAPAPDVVLIAAPRHGIEVVPASPFPP